MMRDRGGLDRFWRLRLPLPAAADYACLRDSSGVIVARAIRMHTLRPHPFAQRETLVGPSLRHGLIARVRREIELGVYDTPEKLEIALERLFASLEERDDEGR